MVWFSTGSSNSLPLRNIVAEEDLDKGNLANQKPPSPPLNPLKRP